MRLIVAPLVVALVSWGPVAMAQAPTEQAVQVAPAAVVTADLRGEYIAGERILVQLTARNDGTVPVQFPDLTARPWLVEFSLQRAGAQVTRYKTTPPATDSGRTVTIAPRGQRRTLLEIPSSGLLAPGEYSVGLTVDIGATKVEISKRTVQLAVAHPVEADLAEPAVASQRAGIDVVWLHQATRGFDLYLLQADGDSPKKVLGDWFLTGFDRRVVPYLAVARGSDRAGRHVTWAVDGRTVAWARLQGTDLRGAPDKVELPWPKAEIAARGATDGQGRLHLPLWVPAPRGVGGEVRVLSVGERGAPSLHRLSSFERRPDAVIPTVDGAGNAHVLVQRPDAVDLYDARDSDEGGGLPLSGLRLLEPAVNERVVASTFGFLADRGTDGGGQAVLVLLRRQDPDGGLPTLVGRWVGLRGQQLRHLPPTLWPDGSVLLQVVPAEDATAGLVIRGPDGSTIYREGAQEVLIPAAAITADWSVVRDAEGRPWLRRTARGVAVESEAIMMPPAI